MANGKKTYTIEINGVKQAIDQVDALMKRIDDLDLRLQRLQTVKVDVTASASTAPAASQAKSDTSRYDAAKSEAAAQKEITDQLALQNEENLKALQALVKKKEQTKEIVKAQQQIAQGIRDESGEYANTLAGRRAMLSDLKKQLAGTEMGTDKWDELRDKVKAVNDEVLNMEKSFGVFGRNVGNYESAFDGLRKFTVTIGDADREFSSLREASRALRMEMQGVDTTTEEGRRLFEDYQNAIHQVSVATDQMADSADRAASSNKGLHDTLELMEGAVGVAQVGQGFASVLGIDDSSLAQQMTKLQGLMSALQGIKTLQDQMERGVGGGGWLAKLWKGLDAPIKSLKALNAQLKTSAKDVAGMGSAGTVGAAGMTAFSVATNVATAAVRAFGKATVIFALLEAALWIVEKLGDALGLLSGKIKNFFTGEEDAKDAALRVTDALEAQNKALETNNEYLEQQVELGKMNVAEMQKKQLEQYAIAIINTSDKLKDLIEDTKKMNEVKTTYNTPDFTATFEQIEKNVKAMESWMSESEFDEEVERMARNAFLSLKDMADKSPEEVARFVAALNGSELFNSGFNRWLKELPEETQEAARGVLDNFTNMSNGVVALLGRMAQAGRDYSATLRSLQIQAMPNGLQKDLAQLEYEHQKRIEDLKRQGQYTQEMEKAEEAAYQRSVKNARDAAAKRNRTEANANRKRVESARKTARELQEIERKIQNDKIQAMRDGLARTLAQLALERRTRIAEAERMHREGKMNEVQYREDLAAINQIYDNKEYESKKKWQDEWEKYQRESATRIAKLQSETALESIGSGQAALSTRRDLANDDVDEKYTKMVLRSFGFEDTMRQLDALDARIQVLNEEFEKGGQKDLEVQKELNGAIEQYNELLAQSEEYYNSYRELGNAMTSLSDAELRVDELENAISAAKSEMALLNEQIAHVDPENGEFLAYLKKELEQAKAATAGYVQELEKLNSETIPDLQRQIAGLSGKVKMPLPFEDDDPAKLLEDWKGYYEERLKIQAEYNRDSAELEKQRIEAEYDENSASLAESFQKEYEEFAKQYDEHINQLKVLRNEDVENEEKYTAEILEAEKEKAEGLSAMQEAYNQKALANEKKYFSDKKENELKWMTDTQEMYDHYYNRLMGEMEDFYGKAADILGKAETNSTNKLGIINPSKYQREIDKAKAMFTQFADDIDQTMTEINARLASGEISLLDWAGLKKELEGYKEDVKEGLELADRMSREKLGKLLDKLNEYLQQLGNGAQELLSTIWDAQGKELDHLEEELNKENDLLEEKLSKQEEITQKHKDTINGIEDELDSARGDRRQHLIDALNAQIQAQRESLAQEKKIEAQKEANQKKLDALDKKRKQEQKKQALVSAAISTALATANALATTPFIPVGVAMGALAAALGAAQIAIIANSKYESGGQLDGGKIQGKRHSQGGVKVMGGRVELEGDEYIVNRRTTMQNLNILEYINGKKRKLTLDDFVEFYKTRRQTPTRTVKEKYFLASGGQVPELDDNFDAGRLIRQVRAQEDNRPIVVSVVDINQAQDRVRKVQTLAGL